MYNRQYTLTDKVLFIVLLITLLIISFLTSSDGAKRFTIYNPDSGTLMEGTINERQGEIYDPNTGTRMEIIIDKNDNAEVYDPDTGNSYKIDIGDETDE